MSKLARTAAIVVLPLAVLLAGCTGGPDTPDGDPTPPFSLEPSAPTPTAELPRGAAIEEWAAVALPENRAGGPAPVLRTSGPVEPGADAVIDIAQGPGVWDLLMTCQTEAGTPLSWLIESPTAAIHEPVDLDCPTPNGGVPTTTIVGFDGPGAQLTLSSSSPAVYAIEVRPHVDQLD